MLSVNAVGYSCMLIRGHGVYYHRFAVRVVQHAITIAPLHEDK